MAIDERTEALRELAEAVRVRAEEIYNGANSGEVSGLADAKDMGRALSRILLGESLRSAFGSPGDWGYETPIGKALSNVYLAQVSR